MSHETNWRDFQDTEDPTGVDFDLFLYWSWKIIILVIELANRMKWLVLGASELGYEAL